MTFAEPSNRELTAQNIFLFQVSAALSTIIILQKCRRALVSLYD